MVWGSHGAGWKNLRSLCTMFGVAMRLFNTLKLQSCVPSFLLFRLHMMTWLGKDDFGWGGFAWFLCLNCINLLFPVLGVP